MIPGPIGGGAGNGRSSRQWWGIGDQYSVVSWVGVATFISPFARSGTLDNPTKRGKPGKSTARVGAGNPRQQPRSQWDT